MEKNMNYKVRAADLATTLLNTSLNSLRRRLKRGKLISLAYTLRTLRTLFHFGPWRVVPQFLIRKFRPVDKRRVLNERSTSLLNSLDAKAIADKVREDSVAIAGVLPVDFVNRLRSVTDHLPVDHYQLMHYIDKDVRQLSEDPAIKNTLRAYFNCEPALLESTLVITGTSAKLTQQNYFHFDYAGWDSLNLFVYLNHVTNESSYHEVAKGSHRSIGFRDMLPGSLTYDQALGRFGSSIEPIIGPAGTVFFENTEAYHRRHPGNERRAMLNILFASHRGWLSNGRTSRKHISRRAQAYEQLRAKLG